MKSTMVVSLEHRFFRVGDDVFTKLAFDRSYWETYLDFFESVVVFARVEDCLEKQPRFIPASGPGIVFHDCPYFLGPLGLLAKFPLVFAAAFRLAQKERRFLLRSGNVSSVLWIFLILFRRDFLREFPGDIKSGVLGYLGEKGSVRLRYRLMSSFLNSLARVQARQAVACAYVSEAVRGLYPSRSTQREYVFSGVALPSFAFRKSGYSLKDEVCLVSVGRLENEKGHKYLILSLTEVARAFPNRRIRLVLVGDGTRRQELESLASSEGVEVSFMGSITDRRLVNEYLVSADAFVLPSLTEGMPRALIEAMALGVPSIASRVGGVPEVLPDSEMFLAGSVSELSDCLCRLLAFSSLEREGLARASEDRVREKFDSELMKARKHDFWARLESA